MKTTPKCVNAKAGSKAAQPTREVHNSIAATWQIDGKSTEQVKIIAKKNTTREGRQGDSSANQSNA